MEVEAIIAATQQTEVVATPVAPVVAAGIDPLQVRELIAVEMLLTVAIDPRVLAAAIDLPKIPAYGKLDKGELG